MALHTSTTPYHEGHADSRICFVAEAPAREEMAQNRPLVGQSGRVFNELLAYAGLIRSDCLIENVSRTPISSIEDMFGKGRLTARGTVAVEDLRQRLASSTANVFVPMGNLALYALTGLDKITKRRGSILSSTMFPGRKVIPTIHPAATLPFRGKYVWRYPIVDDLRRIKRHGEFPELRLPARTLHTYPTLGHAKDFLAHCRRYSKLAVDIECINHQVSCISFAVEPSEAMSIPFVGFGVPNPDGPHAWNEHEEMEIWRLIARLLGNPSTTKCIQNAMFDMSFLWLRNKILTRGPIADPMLRHRIMYPDLPAGLDYLTSIFTEEPYYKDDGKLWSSIGRDPKRFYEYNAKDSVCALEADNALADIMSEDEHYSRTYSDTMRLVEPCLYMMTKGMRVNHAELSKTRTEIQGTVKRLTEQLAAIAELPFNPNSPKQCMKYFYGVKGLKPYVSKRKRPNGTVEYTPTCDDKALARIVRRDRLPEAKLVQEIRSNSKLLGTYLDINYDADGFLRCFYNLRGTTTTRLSSSKTIFDTGMNMQNLDPRYKKFLIPEDALS